MRSKQVVNVLIIISVLNLVAILLKFGIGLYVNSSAVIADGFHSLSDLLANFVGIIAIKLSTKPADDNHGFGHEKIENLASLLISLLLIFTSGQLFLNAINNYGSNEVITISNLSLVLMAVTLVINIVIVTYEKRAGERLKSEFLISDSKHTLSDIYITIGVIINMIVIRIGFPAYIDTIVSVIIAVLILIAGLKIFFNATSILIDTSVIDNKQLEKIIYSFSEVKEVHYLKNRGNRVNIYLDFHVMFDRDMSVYDAHEIVEQIEEAIKEAFDYHFIFSVHIEPYVDQYKIKRK